MVLRTRRKVSVILFLCLLEYEQNREINLTTFFFENVWGNRIKFKYFFLMPLSMMNILNLIFKQRNWNFWKQPKRNFMFWSNDFDNCGTKRLPINLCSLFTAQKINSSDKTHVNINQNGSRELARLSDTFSRNWRWNTESEIRDLNDSRYLAFSTHVRQWNSISITARFLFPKNTAFLRALAFFHRTLSI